MTNDDTPGGLASTEGLGLAPERAAYASWLADTHAPALRQMDSDGAHAAGYAAGVAAERERFATPTEAMELAGMRALRNTYRTVSGEYSREQARACWDAMLAAMSA